MTHKQAIKFAILVGLLAIARYAPAADWSTETVGEDSVTFPVMKSPFGLHYLRTERTLALISGRHPHWIWMCGYEVNGAPVYVSANIVCPVTLEETKINRK